MVFPVSGGSSVERGWHGGRRGASDGGTEGAGSSEAQGKVAGWEERGREPWRTGEAGNGGARHGRRASVAEEWERERCRQLEKMIERPRDGK